MATKMKRGTDSTKDLQHDVTEPGTFISRAKPIRASEEHGGPLAIWNSWLNRGTNYSREERHEMHLEGLLPPVFETLDLQAERVMCQLAAGANDLARYRVLMQLLSSSTTLFYKVLVDNINELAHIVYTPTVGEACLKLNRIYRAPLGMYLSAFVHRGRFKEVLSNWPSHNVQIIVVTDGSRILGLGDLGTNGIGISIGKISLYVAGAGFHPEHSLPLVVDMGCNNKELCGDKFYMGSKENRLEGEEYYQVIDDLCTAVKEKWPDALLQFEDFSTDKAFEILRRQRDKLLCFNDDIQGTGAVVVAGVINGLKAQKTPLDKSRVLFYGAGSSAVGVAQSLAAYFQHVGNMSEDQAAAGIYIVDSKGLITTTRGDKLPQHKQMFARRDDTPNMKNLKEIVGHVKPHVLIGLSAAGPSWGQEVVEELCRHVEAPLIFPLSNPTDKAEITAQQAYEWSKGKCVFAAGSPFDPVEYGGKTFVPGQANNVFIFPGTGFGAVMAKATKVTDGMFTAASTALAGCVNDKQMSDGNLYPPMSQLREVSSKVAAAVAKAAWDDGASRLSEKPDDWLEYIKSRMWYPTEATTLTAGLRHTPEPVSPRAASREA